MILKIVNGSQQIQIMPDVNMKYDLRARFKKHKEQQQEPCGTLAKLVDRKSRVRRKVEEVCP